MKLFFTVLALLPFFMLHFAHSQDSIECAVTETVFDQPPKDPNADPFFKSGWYINSNRTVWAGWDAASMKVGTNKVLWIRPKDTTLKVTALHLNGSGLFEARVPQGYITGFQATGLSFTKPGCWKISATSGDESLEFITIVKQ